MFGKIGRLAEAAANNVSVSRRGFLGRLGKGALGAAGVLGGALAFGRQARAGSGGYYCCTYQCKLGKPYHSKDTVTYCYYGGCQAPDSGCTLQGKKQVSACTQC